MAALLLAACTAGALPLQAASRSPLPAPARRPGPPRAAPPPLTPHPSRLGRAARPPTELKPLKIAVPNHATSQLHVYATKSLGIYEQYGFDAEIASSRMPSTGMAALQSGEIDLYTGTTTAMNAALRGLPVRVTLISANYADFVIVAAPDLTDVAQLRGKVVAGFGRDVRQFHDGRVAAAPGAEPERLRDAQRGRQSGALGGQWGSVGHIGRQRRILAARARWVSRAGAGAGLDRDSVHGAGASQAAIQSHPDTLKAAMLATLDGMKVIVNQKDVVVPVIAKEFEFSVEDAGSIYDGLRASFPLDGKPTPGAVQFVFALSQQDLGLSEPIRPNKSMIFRCLTRSWRAASGAFPSGSGAVESPNDSVVRVRER